MAAGRDSGRKRVSVGRCRRPPGSRRGARHLPAHSRATGRALLARRTGPQNTISLPTLGELIAMRVASAVAYRLSIKGGGRSFLVETGYRGAIGSAGRLVRLSREAPPRAVELPAGLVLPLTYAILGMLSQGPCCQVGGPPPPAAPEFRFAFESAAPFRSAGQGAGCRCGAGARDATSQET